jgi:hypothetical protein
LLAREPRGNQSPIAKLTASPQLKPGQFTKVLDRIQMKIHNAAKKYLLKNTRHTMAKACVVRTRESNDKLPRSLYSPIYRNIVI